MTDNVIRAAFGAQQADPERLLNGSVDAAAIEQLQKEGLITEANPGGIDDIKLPEPAYGEVTLGTLTDEEAVLFMAFYNAKRDLEHTARMLNAETLIGFGSALRDKKDDDFGVGDFITNEQAHDFFRKERLVDYAKAKLYFALGEKYQCHDHQIGIRTKRRVVKGKSKWRPE